jgi:F-type H+-transporting ATPase subunit delta
MKTTRQANREATQLFRACFVDGLLDESRVRQVVQRITDARPRGYLQTLQIFKRLVKLDFYRRAARIESALPLPNELRTSVQADLAKEYGRGLNTSFSQNPALIAGMRIKVGSDVYDGSIQGRLAAIEQSFCE